MDHFFFDFVFYGIYLLGGQTDFGTLNIRFAYILRAIGKGSTSGKILCSLLAASAAEEVAKESMANAVNERNGT